MPFIGVTTSASTGEGPARISLNAAYLHALQAAGGIPVLLPPFILDAQLNALLENLDGLLLTGGGDVDPSRYGEKAHPATTGISAPRDTLEVTVTRWALAERKPIFAVCRGMQVLNVTLGGTLVQHIPDQYGESIAHSQVDAGYRRDEVTHAIDIRGGTLLANLAGVGGLGVNSMHHQSIHRPGDHLVITARSSDGVVEAVEGPGLGPFVLGVQWHPEELAATNEAAAKLFSGFVAAASGLSVGAPERTHAIRV